MPTEDLEQLAETCLAATKTIKSYLATSDLPQMTFDQNGPAVFPQATSQVQYARLQLRDAAQRLADLAAGPDDVLTHHVYNCTYKIAATVPFNDSISYSSLAAKTGVNTSQLRQVLHQLIMIHVFHEPAANQVAHTASSKLLLQEGIGSWNAFVTVDCLPLVNAQLSAIDKWGHGAQETTQAPASLAYQTDKPLFDYYESVPEVRDRFSKLMTYVSREIPSMSSEHTAAGFDWHQLSPDPSSESSDPTTVVDIGGNVGSHSIAIATANPNLQIIVQDLPQTVARATDPQTSIIPADLRNRISFMSHCFYDEQPIPAAAYFLRMIMHDYSDKYCTKILQALVPAMQTYNQSSTSKSRIIIMDQVMPAHAGHGTPGTVERMMRTMDMQMWTLLNGKERDLDEWHALLAAADPRLKIVGVRRPEGSTMSLIEVVLDSEGR